MISLNYGRRRPSSCFERKWTRGKSRMICLHYGSRRPGSFFERKRALGEKTHSFPLIIGFNFEMSRHAPMAPLANRTNESNQTNKSDWTIRVRPMRTQHAEDTRTLQLKLFYQTELCIFFLQAHRRVCVAGAVGCMASSRTNTWLNAPLRQAVRHGPAS